MPKNVSRYNEGFDEYHGVYLVPSFLSSTLILIIAHLPLKQNRSFHQQTFANAVVRMMGLIRKYSNTFSTYTIRVVARLPKLKDGGLIMLDRNACVRRACMLRVNLWGKRSQT